MPPYLVSKQTAVWSCNIKAMITTPSWLIIWQEIRPCGQKCRTSPVLPPVCTTSTLYNRMKCGREAIGAFGDYISTVQGMFGFHVKVQERADHTVVPDTSLPYKMMFSLDLALKTSSNVDVSSVKDEEAVDRMNDVI